MPSRKYLDNSEPTTDELLADPIAHLLMERDCIRPEQVRAVIKETKTKLREQALREMWGVAGTP